MKIGTFEQQPFEAGDKKLADLTGEPSKSNVSVDLDFGALVVKTKKLIRVRCLISIRQWCGGNTRNGISDGIQSWSGRATGCY